MKFFFPLRLALLPISLGVVRAETSGSAGNLSGLHDFDFQVGEWRVHHRVKRPSGEWYEFEGTCSNRPLMEGWGNVEDNTFHKPDGDAHGVALRTYDPKSGQWAIWWVDGRDPHGVMDPPVKGVFKDGVGQFYSDSLVNGRTIRMRYTWSHITATTARWEQAFSADAGKTWDTNWKWNSCESPRADPRRGRNRNSTQRREDAKTRRMRSREWARFSLTVAAVCDRRDWPAWLPNGGHRPPLQGERSNAGTQR